MCAKSQPLKTSLPPVKREAWLYFSRDYMGP